MTTKVLIVEDDLLNRMFYEAVFKQRGYELMLVEDGARVLDAVDAGYKQASRTIFDANVTNIIAALIMFWLGSGPINGFAVVLSIGIITSVFTAVTFTRLLAAGWLRGKRPKAITI